MVDESRGKSTLKIVRVTISRARVKEIMEEKRERLKEIVDFLSDIECFEPTIYSENSGVVSAMKNLRKKTEAELEQLEGLMAKPEEEKW